MSDIDELWETLSPREQAHAIELLVERVEYDGQRGSASLTFHACGIKEWIQETANRQEDAA